MDTITIGDPGDRSYPFRRELFEDPCVVYHGSWSTWSSQIEATGFRQGDFPFEWECVETVCNRNRAIGRGSFLAAFVGKQRNLFFAANFWFARAYAADGGGEIVRKAIEEADTFERICSVPAERDELVQYLRATSQPATISILTDDEALSRIRTDVKAAKHALMSLTVGGHPVVYAVAVEPNWFGDWTRHMSHWEMGIRLDLQCQHDVAPEKSLAVDFPAAPGSVLSQLGQLHFGALPVACRNSGIQSDAHEYSSESGGRAVEPIDTTEQRRETGKGNPGLCR